MYLPLDRPVLTDNAGACTEISVGSSIRSALIHTVSYHRMKPLLRAGDYDAAVKNAAVDLGMAFAQQAAGDDGGDSEGSSSLPFVLFGGLIASIFGFVAWCAMPMPLRSACMLKQSS